MYFCSGKSQRHASPTVNADFASKDPVRSSRLSKLHAILQGLHFEVASLRKSNAVFPQQSEDVSLTIKGHILTPRLSTNRRLRSRQKIEEHEPASLDNPRLRPLNNSESRLLTIQSCVFQQFKVASINKLRVMFSK